MSEETKDETASSSHSGECGELLQVTSTGVSRTVDAVANFKCKLCAEIHGRRT